MSRSLCRLMVLAALAPGAVRGKCSEQSGCAPVDSALQRARSPDWTIKFAKHDLGENFRNTFRVEDGLLKVRYDQWPTFNGEFGHIFYKDPFSYYLLAAEYRFVGEQVAGGADLGDAQQRPDAAQPEPAHDAAGSGFPDLARDPAARRPGRRGREPPPTCVRREPTW